MCYIHHQFGCRPLSTVAYAPPIYFFNIQIYCTRISDDIFRKSRPCGDGRCKICGVNFQNILLRSEAVITYPRTMEGWGGWGWGDVALN